MGIERYYTTAGSNTDVDGINIAEGMAPNLVNNAMRQMVANVRKWFNDAEWVQFGSGDGPPDISYVSATSFTVNGVDVTDEYHAGRRVKAVGSSTGTIYGTIQSSDFVTNTTVTVDWDSGQLENEALEIYLAILRAENPSLPTGDAVRDHLGLGSMATQDADSVAITGGSATLDTAHVQTGSSGATAGASFNNLIVEDSDNAGLSILSPNTAFGGIAFGDPEDNDAGRIWYNHSTDRLALYAGGVNSVTVDASGVDATGYRRGGLAFVGAFAWVTYNAVTAEINNSFNVSSVTDLGTGIYRINFATALPTAHYAINGIATDDNSGGACILSRWGADTKTTSQCVVRVFSHNGTLVDVPNIYVSFIA